jgi:hypothetical protein
MTLDAMNSPHLLEYLTAIGAVATPILVLVLTAIGWTIRSRLERRFDLEDKLREDRIATYNKILEPYIILFMTDAAWQADSKNKGKNKYQVAERKLRSLEYRQEGFRLSLVGSDEVVKAYNNLMQYFFQRGENAAQPTEGDLKKMLSLMGTLLLEIRRSMGNEATALNNWEMLEWFLTDARKYSLRRTQ